MSKPPTRAGRTKASKDVKGKSAQAEKQPATLLEIVPGKFNENDWNNMLEIEDSQEFVWEIVDEMFGNSMRIVYDNYIKKQTIPYVINEARKAILHIIEWQFMTNDVDDDLCHEWIEDKEPEACTIDSWAQGYVETIQLEPEPSAESRGEGEFMNESSTAAGEKLEFLEELNRMAGGGEEDKPAGAESSMASPKTQGSSASRVRSLDEEVRLKVEASKQKAAKMREKRRMLDAIARRKVEADREAAARLLKEQDESVGTQEKKDEPIFKAPVPCQSLLKTLLSRPAALREIELDSTGQVQSMAKLDLMPTTGVKVRFSVINENAKQQGVAALDTMSKKAQSNSNNNPKMSIGTISTTPSSNISSKLYRWRKSPPRRISKASNFIDQEDEMMIEPASGVIFSMMNSTRAGPKRSTVSMKHQLMFEKSETQLRPVRQFDSEAASLTRSSIEQILSSNSNNIKLPMRKPIPPINPSSTTVN